ncbi:DNA-binding response regulator, partial [Paenibacillus sepulcri]|nr:DNA-binding response regulator [Paenibacillus sepulcri]
SPKHEREMIAVYTMKGGYPEDASFRSAHLAKKTAAALQQLFGMSVAAAIGPDGSDVMHIADSYESAKASINGVDLLKLNGTVVAGAAGKTGGGESHSIMSRMPLIRGALDAGNFNHARNMLSDFTKQMQASGGFTLGEADRILHEFVLLLS